MAASALGAVAVEAMLRADRGTPFSLASDTFLLWKAQAKAIN